MAYIDPNKALVGLVKGKLGDMYVAQYGDKFLLKRRPQQKHKSAGPPQKNRANLLKINAYWRQVKAQPELKVLYERAAHLKGKRAIDLAKADFMHPPEVTSIDVSGHTGQPGDMIRVQAQDDFEVVSVSVRILGLSGEVIEQGAATFEAGSGCWRYAASTILPAGKPVVVEATATDRASNSTSRTLDHVCGPRS